MVTIKDIANMADVSRGTVDRVLNNRGGVSPRTEARIRMIAEKLNYSPSITGRGLAAMKKELKFGFIMTANLRGHSALSRALDRKTTEYKEYGISVLTRFFTKGNLSELLEVMEALKEEGISGLALPGIADKSMEEAVNQLVSQGVPVVLYEHDLPDSKRLAYVGCDFYRNGQTLGGVMRLLLNGKGKVGIMSGQLAAQEYSRRLEGLNDYLAKLPEIQLVASRVCDEDDVSTYTAVKKLLEDCPDMDLLLVNVISSFGSMRAVKECPNRVRVITTNRVSGMEDYFEDGTVDAAVSHRPWKVVEMTLDVLFRYLVWGKKPDFSIYYAADEIAIAENLRTKHTHYQKAEAGR